MNKSYVIAKLIDLMGLEKYRDNEHYDETMGVISTAADLLVALDNKQEVKEVMKVARIGVGSCYHCPHRVINPDAVNCYYRDELDSGSKSMRDVTEHFDAKTIPGWCTLPDYDKHMTGVSRYGSPVPNIDQTGETKELFNVIDKVMLKKIKEKKYHVVESDCEDCEGTGACVHDKNTCPVMECRNLARCKFPICPRCDKGKIRHAVWAPKVNVADLVYEVITSDGEINKGHWPGFIAEQDYKEGNVIAEGVLGKVEIHPAGIVGRELYVLKAEIKKVT